MLCCIVVVVMVMVVVIGVCVVVVVLGELGSAVGSEACSELIILQYLFVLPFYYNAYFNGVGVSCSSAAA